MFEYKDIRSWRDDSKCKDVPDPEIFYPPREGGVYNLYADQAKAICRGTDGMPECPVRFQCLLYADFMDDNNGIWGGFSHRERNSRKKKAAAKGMTLEQWVEKEIDDKAKRRKKS